MFGASAVAVAVAVVCRSMMDFECFWPITTLNDTAVNVLLFTSTHINLNNNQFFPKTDSTHKTDGWKAEPLLRYAQL